MTGILEGLGAAAGEDGTVAVSAVRRLVEGSGWVGRLAEVLVVVAESSPSSRSPAELGRSAELWSGSALPVRDIRTVIRAGGADPQPFVVLSELGLLDATLCRRDGTPLRIRGELAGVWVSGQLTQDRDLGPAPVRPLRRLVA